MRPSTASTSIAAGTARSSTSSSPFTSIRSAWKVRLPGWPPVLRVAAGMTARSRSTSSPLRSHSRSARRRTIARAILPANRSSPYSRRIRARSRSSYVLSTSAAVSSWVESIRMSSGASCA